MTSIINKSPKNVLPLNVDKFQEPEQMVEKKCIATCPQTNILVEILVGSGKKMLEI
jgi:hypothetical protein